MIILSLYSTVFSCLYLVIAIRAPRYGKLIGSDGTLTSANASLLTAFFAKTIEITFATAFVSFLGQVLWRRASTGSKRTGVTLADIDMRSWVTQPGTMFTHSDALRHSIISRLGILTLLAAVMSLLYTTASEALVQPHLKFGNWENKSLQGLVIASWGNSQYLAKKCASPTKDGDAEEGPTTCTQIQYAAQGFHNFQRYLSDWQERVQNGNGTTVLADRPQAFALLSENTTVTGKWIETRNEMTLLHGRVVNNITMAMPHAAVTSAARDGLNEIMQPEVFVRLI